MSPAPAADLQVAAQQAIAARYPAPFGGRAREAAFLGLDVQLVAGAAPGIRPGEGRSRRDQRVAPRTPRPRVGGRGGCSRSHARPCREPGRSQQTACPRPPGPAASLGHGEGEAGRPSAHRPRLPLDVGPWPPATGGQCAGSVPISGLVGGRWPRSSTIVDVVVGERPQQDDAAANRRGRRHGHGGSAGRPPIRTLSRLVHRRPGRPQAGVRPRLLLSVPRRRLPA